MRFGSYLVKRGKITDRQLWEALKSQVLYGGRLGTNLVEAGFIDVDQLGLALGEFHGLPVATKDDFTRVDARTIAAFAPDRIAGFPIQIGEREAIIAMHDPRDDLPITKAESILGVSLSVRAAPEIRIFYYLEQHYGHKRDPKRLRKNVAEGFSERRQILKTSRSISARIPVPQPNPPRDGAIPIPTTVAIEDCCHGLDRAKSREDIAKAITTFCPGRFSYFASFLVKDGIAFGWDACIGNEHVSERVERLALPLDQSSAFQASYDRKRIFIGPPPAAGRPVERSVWKAIGCPEPAGDIFTFPVVVEDNVVLLLYGHGCPNPILFTQEAAAFCARIEESFSRLLDRACKQT